VLGLAHCAVLLAPPENAFDHRTVGALRRTPTNTLTRSSGSAVNRAWQLSFAPTCFGADSP
jgi:hypothetical protein